MDMSSLLNVNAFSLVSSKGHWRNAWKVDVTIAVEANGGGTAKSSNSTSVKQSKQSKQAKERDESAALMNKYAVLKSLK